MFSPGKTVLGQRIRPQEEVYGIARARERGKQKRQCGNCGVFQEKLKRVKTENYRARINSQTNEEKQKFIARKLK